MEQDIKLAFLCGNYEAVKKTGYGERAVVIGQTTETGNEILAKGREYHKVIAEQGKAVVFSNNDHFLNGIRLAVIDGTINPEDVEIYFYANADTGKPKWLSINKNGRLNEWPEGFFDGIENALAQII